MPGDSCKASDFPKLSSLTPPASQPPTDFLVAPQALKFLFWCGILWSQYTQSIGLLIILIYISHTIYSFLIS